MTALLEAPTSFDVGGPLPTGTTVLEASAGTGKTYTIAALAARYVAEGRATLPQVMLVTFGREATRELRERVRERFVRTERGLADPEAARRNEGDPVTRLLAQADDTEVAARRARLTAALAGFDAATIATTHQFCQDMLTGLGIAGDTDPDGTFVERIDDVVTEVVDDFYLRKYAVPGAGAPDFDRAEALEIGRAVVGDPSAGIAPGPEAEGPAGARASFARAVRAEVERRKRRRRLFTFDDMLTRLRNALVDARLGDAACARLRARFSVVLVDEFQDTDPIQWEILRVAFHGHSALTFIGDPKQAIYAFRGADVVSYLEAVESAGTKSGLATNWRSDAPLVRALEKIFNNAALGDEKIVVPHVEAAHQGRRLVGAPRPAPFRLRVLPREGLRSRFANGLPIVAGVREKVAADLAADVAELVAAESRWEEAGRVDPTLGPGDVAVLVRTNAQAALVREALTAAGVPSVLAGATSVFATESAEEWRTLLEAVEQPGRPARVRAAALTVFLGHAAADLDAHADAVLPEVGASLRRWGAVLHDRGVAAFLEAVAAETGLAARVLARVDGERRITDIRHLGQVLHAAAAESRLGVVALAEWLRARMAEAAAGTGELRPERSRRLESDAGAVQVLTIHKCKGLEYPVVYVPFGWDRWVSDEPKVVTHHDEHKKRVRAVGGATDPAWRDHVTAAREEDDGEDLRLLYVALTRAQGQVVCWWAPSTTTKPSAVHRLLIGRPAPGTGPDRLYPVWEDARVFAHLEALADDDVAVERVEPRRPVPYVPDAGDHHPLAAAPFDRALDLAWRRSSYSSLTAGAHAGSPVASEPEDRTVADETDPEDAPPTEADEVEPVPSPMADLPVGPSFGTLVHSVLETVDTAAGDLHAALVDAARTELTHRPHDEVDAATLAEALLPVMRTPLPAGGPATLADVAPRDRLAELDFELPLAGGDRVRPGTPPVTLLEVAALLRRHLPADDPLADYPDALEHPGAHGVGDQVLRGYLTGSIDGVLRGPDGRFVVVDYKTNWLGPIGPTGRAALTAAHYGPRAMAAAMIASHYPLQAALYAVALHRFLRWRLPGYDPATHLGGVLYLFLRGMCGPDAPVVDGTACGVFAWNPSPALVVDLSTLLDGGGR
ncbi:RecBCD enzyme subunit RecB [Actinomycetospora sp. NBRC 106375]|uniref:UvrD-helicase domain-containing protein n=1 Tax=Actinomycetospora sp. NBRC 106375 TaxID=3032207 RepID=UPI0024A11213|nr:UvrD-helicase domain-containing protein [Actinomycetospora sp. NBRC 106375]GLZ45923.1 RecBCD enzyme subunit RecB [Actinomycetospora sp. NBRC 106375]